jgi:hypothetical protein
MSRREREWEEYLGKEKYAQLKGEQAARKAAFWAPVPLPPIPFLQSLYDLVLARSEKRMPKWKFRLGPDLLLEIQPKLTRTGRRFELSALQCEGASAALLNKPRSEIGQPWTSLLGAIVDTGATEWMLKFTYVSSHGGDRAAYPVARQTLRESVLARFRDGRFYRFDPQMLLGSHCLCCGKALTDPVSQARFIGPECAGTASVRIPWIADVGTSTNDLFGDA